MKKVSLYLLSFFYVVAGLNHFINPDMYLKMIPPWLPAHDALNLLSGAAEMLLGMMLIRGEVRSMAAWGIILLLIAIFPANLYMFTQGGAAYGVPDWVLLVRLPLQLLLAGWAYLHTKNPEFDRQAIRTEIEIKASADIVWKALTDFVTYPEWNPFILSARGSGVVGEKLEIMIRPPDGSEFRFKSLVIERVETSSFAWRGSFLFRGLFDGTHYYRLEKTTDGVRFEHGEAFEGVLVGVLAKLMGPTKRGFQLMNEALKKRCE